MAGRNRVVRQTDNMREFREDPRLVMHRGLPPPHPAVVLEEELEFRDRQIQKIVADNRHLVDDNTGLQRELSAVRDDVHRLSQAIPKVRADKEAHIRELMDRGLKLEAELRSLEPLKAEVVQLRAESQKLKTIRQDLSAQVQTLTKDINRAKADNQQLVVMKVDIEQIHKELAEARRVIEYEKKANEELVGQNQAMEKNLVSMAREIEKLRAEQVGAERRAQVPPGVSSYGIMNRSPEGRHRPNPYGDPYARRGWGPYDSHHGPAPRR